MRDDAPEIMETDHEKKFLLDPYLDWVAAEGPPVYEGFGLDLLALETGPWPRFDAKGAFCHVKGRGDFCTCYLLELDPGKPTAPPFWMFHQHFNTAPEPARCLAIGMGSRRYPFSTMRREGAAGKSDADIKKGGRQIEYSDQNPRLHQQWLDAIAKTGVPSDMGEFIDETPFRN